MYYWVTWMCEGNIFDACYETAEDRDDRADELAQDDWVSDIKTWDAS